LRPTSPSLAFLGGPRAGIIAYDALHFDGWPLALATVGVLAEEPVAIQVALIWLAHLGLDRMLGYGLRIRGTPPRATWIASDARSSC
jgi:hypothetical protein